MIKLFTVVLICMVTLLFSGCGVVGFSVGLSYNEWGVSIDVKGATPTDLNTIDDPTIQK